MFFLSFSFSQHVSSTCFFHHFLIDFSTIFRPFFDQKSKKNRYEKWSKKWLIFLTIFSSILVDLGLHFGAPAFHHSPVWASWAALWRCLGPSCAICFEFLLLLAPFLIQFAPLGSIFDQICSSWLHFLRIFDKLWLHFLISEANFQWFWDRLLFVLSLFLFSSACLFDCLFVYSFAGSFVHSSNRSLILSFWVLSFFLSSVLPFFLSSFSFSSSILFLPFFVWWFVGWFVFCACFRFCCYCRRRRRRRRRRCSCCCCCCPLRCSLLLLLLLLFVGSFRQLTNATSLARRTARSD